MDQSISDTVSHSSTNQDTPEPIARPVDAVISDQALHVIRRSKPSKPSVVRKTVLSIRSQGLEEQTQNEWRSYESAALTADAGEFTKGWDTAVQRMHVNFDKIQNDMQSLANLSKTLCALLKEFQDSIAELQTKIDHPQKQSDAADDISSE